MCNELYALIPSGDENPYSSDKARALLSVGVYFLQLSNCNDMDVGGVYNSQFRSYTFPHIHTHTNAFTILHRSLILDPVFFYITFVCARENIFRINFLNLYFSYAKIVKFIFFCETLLFYIIKVRWRLYILPRHPFFIHPAHLGRRRESNSFLIFLRAAFVIVKKVP